MNSGLEFFTLGSLRVRQFIGLNSTVMPTVTINSIPQTAWMFPRTCAYYRKDVINICLIKCRGVRNSMGRNWNWPGSTTDKTPYGVLAHELGHHADFHSGRPKGSYSSLSSTEVKEASGEKDLTSYCPNNGEWFAEMFRLFVTNPDLLAQLRPKTYDELTKRFCPLPRVPWLQALQGFTDDAGAIMKVPSDIVKALTNKGAR